MTILTKLTKSFSNKGVFWLKICICQKKAVLLPSFLLHVRTTREKNIVFAHAQNHPK